MTCCLPSPCSILLFHVSLELACPPEGVRVLKSILPQLLCPLLLLSLLPCERRTQERQSLTRPSWSLLSGMVVTGVKNTCMGVLSSKGASQASLTSSSALVPCPPLSAWIIFPMKTYCTP